MPTSRQIQQNTYGFRSGRESRVILCCCKSACLAGYISNVLDWSNLSWTRSSASRHQRASNGFRRVSAIEPYSLSFVPLPKILSKPRIRDRSEEFERETEGRNEKTGDDAVFQILQRDNENCDPRTISSHVSIEKQNANARNSSRSGWRHPWLSLPDVVSLWLSCMHGIPACERILGVRTRA